MKNSSGRPIGVWMFFCYNGENGGVAVWDLFITVIRSVGHAEKQRSGLK